MIDLKRFPYISIPLKTIDNIWILKEILENLISKYTITFKYDNSGKQLYMSTDMIYKGEIVIEYSKEDYNIFTSATQFINTLFTDKRLRYIEYILISFRKDDLREILNFILTRYGIDITIFHSEVVLCTFNDSKKISLYNNLNLFHTYNMEEFLKMFN